MSDRGQEREVKVGILKAQEIRVVFHSAYLLDGKSLVGEHCFTPTAEERLFGLELGNRFSSSYGR